MNIKIIPALTLATCMALASTSAIAASKPAAKASKPAPITATMSAADKAKLENYNSRLEKLNYAKYDAEAAKRVKTAYGALQYEVDKKMLSPKQYERKLNDLQKDMLKTEQKVLNKIYVDPIDAELKKMRASEADDYAYYAYKKTKRLGEATEELIEKKPADVQEIARFSEAALIQAKKTGSLGADAHKITRIGERDAERFIAHVSWLFDQINKNSANPVDLTGKSLDERAAAIIGKPLPPTPLQVKQAAEAKAKADKAKAEADKKAAKQQAAAKLKAAKAKAEADKKAAKAKLAAEKKAAKEQAAKAKAAKAKGAK